MSITQISQKNDLMRKTFIGCRVLITRGVNALDNKTKERVIEAVQNFNDFNENNDPYGEHDFGKVVVDDEEYFWKFDYYDDEYKYFKEDGNRVLTIMRVDEY